MELSRLLRRGLLVAAIAAGGWLLSVVFAGTASADEAPQNTPAQSGGLLGGLVNGLTGTLGGVTSTVTGITETLAQDAPPPAAAQDEEPVVDLPVLLSGSASGSASTERDPGLPPPDLTPAPTPAPQVTAPPPPPVVVTPPAPTPPPAPPAPVPPAPAPTAGTEHAGDGVPGPAPVKTPTTPANSGTIVSLAHDGYAGAKSTHGVLPAQTTFHPADAGFTTRSRAVSAAGRVAGLPASSPD